MPTITPFLWFDREAEEAAHLYVTVFGGDSRILAVSRYPDGSPGGPKGRVMTVQFEVRGQRLTALNGGPHFKFTEAFSLMVECESQAEVDRVWAALTDGGTPGQCGWLKDRYGLSWQIVPAGLGALLGDPDPERARRATAAMLKMGKLDLAAMRRAADGE